MPPPRGARLYEMPSAVARVIVPALSHLLAAAPWTRARLSAHAGCSARVCCGSVELRLAVDGDGYLLVADEDATIDVTLRIPASALPQLLAGDGERVMRETRLEGNAEFADALGFVFRNLRWDAEEDLSRVVGDILAHRIVSSARALRDGQSRAAAAFGGSLSEYLAEEQQMLVNRSALDIFAEDLQALRDDIARLDKRARRIGGNTRPASGRR